MQLKNYRCPTTLAEAIRRGYFSYQTVLNYASKLKSKGEDDYRIFSLACKEYTKMKKCAINNFLKEWSEGD